MTIYDNYDIIEKKAAYSAAERICIMDNNNNIGNNVPNNPHQANKQASDTPLWQNVMNSSSKDYNNETNGQYVNTQSVNDQTTKFNPIPSSPVYPQNYPQNYGASGYASNYQRQLSSEPPAKSKNTALIIVAVIVALIAVAAIAVSVGLALALNNEKNTSDANINNTPSVEDDVLPPKDDDSSIITVQDSTNDTTPEKEAVEYESENETKTEEPVYIPSGPDYIDWQFDYATGTVTISGQGPMESYDRTEVSANTYRSSAPWCQYGSDIKRVVIEEGITNVGECAFTDLPNLRSISIPRTVTQIDIAAFYNCTGLEAVTVPGNVKTIRRKAFAFCTSLKYATLENGVETVGGSVFYECHKLKSVSIPNSVTQFGGWNFFKCYELERVYLPDGIEGIDEWTFGYCSKLKHVDLPNYTEYIGNHAFYGCSALESVTIPQTVTSIGEAVMGMCSSMRSTYYEGSYSRWANVDVEANNDTLHRTLVTE